LPKRDARLLRPLPKRILRAHAAIRNYRKRIKDESPPYNPVDTWGKFSDEFNEEFDK
jgi:hypothetical protein